MPGWNLPDGCIQEDIDRAAGADDPLPEVYADDCVCDGLGCGKCGGAGFVLVDEDGDRYPPPGFERTTLANTIEDGRECRRPCRLTLTDEHGAEWDSYATATDALREALYHAYHYGPVIIGPFGEEVSS